MIDLSNTSLFIIIVVLVVFSAFFSSSETSLTALNKYRLQHEAKKNNKRATRILNLLSNPDKILSTILIGNTFANILASTIATILAIRLAGDYGSVIAPIFLTIVILIFAEIAPKTFAALYPEKVIYPASLMLAIILKLMYPVVVLINGISRLFLILFNIKVDKSIFDPLTKEDLRGLLTHEESLYGDDLNKEMLVGVMNLENITVDDIMLPRNEIVALDINMNWNEILKTIKMNDHKKLIVYKDNIDGALGTLDLLIVIELLEKNCLNKNTIISNLKKVNYIPEGTSLQQQLQNFKSYKYHIGLVVNEYGDTLGLISLEDILEEITGKIYQHLGRQETMQHISDGSIIVSGNYHVRDINRVSKFDLPVDGPSTVSGLIINYLEEIPDGCCCCVISGYRIEILSYQSNKIYRARIYSKTK